MFCWLLFNINFIRVKHLYVLNKKLNYTKLNNCSFVQETLSNCEIRKFLIYLSSLKDTKYKEGGNNPKEGLDCSGLIVYIYNELGYRWFRDSLSLVTDVSADVLYHFNVKKIQNIKQLKPGDLIFFYANNEKIIEHVSVFIRKDKKNSFWVMDATDYPDGRIVKKVSYRKIYNFYKKHPLFGRPLKTIKNISLWDYLNFP